MTTFSIARTLRTTTVLLLGIALVTAFVAACGGDDTVGQTNTPSASSAFSATRTGSSNTSSAGTNGASTDTPGDTGSGDTGAASGTECKLLTKDEVTQAVGANVSGFSPTADVCGYDTENGIVAVSRIDIGDDNGASTTYSLTKDAITTSAEDVSGLGDEAFWANDLHTLYIRKGGNIVYVQLALGNKSDDELKNIAKGLAEKVLSRI